MIYIYYDGLIGDTINLLPLMHKLNEVLDGNVQLFLGPSSGYVRKLFINSGFEVSEYNENPTRVIVKLDEHKEIYVDKLYNGVTYVPSTSEAFSLSFKNKEHFCHGYLRQFGMNTENPDRRINYEIYRNDIIYNDYIIVSPYSRSCSSPMTGGGNKTSSTGWWIKLIGELRKKFDNKIIVLGSKSDSIHLWDYVEDVLICADFDLLDVAFLLKCSKIFIGVDNGILNLAGCHEIARHVIYLNSATPPYMAMPQINPNYGTVQVIKANKPEEWKIEEVMESVEAVLCPREEVPKIF